MDTGPGLTDDASENLPERAEPGHGPVPEDLLALLERQVGERRRVSSKDERAGSGRQQAQRESDVGQVGRRERQLELVRQLVDATGQVAELCQRELLG